MSSPIVLHPAFVQAKDALLRALVTDVPGQLIFVIGLSGAGKSEIRYATMQAYAGNPKGWGRGHLPAIAVRATPSDRSYFSSKEFAMRLYVELREPNLGWLTHRSAVDDPDDVHLRSEERLTDSFWKNFRYTRTEHDLRSHFERMAVARGLRAIFVEQAASITRTNARKDPRDHMESYMCLAEEIGVTLVLFGVPAASVLWKGKAEIRRRSRFVFVERYRLSDANDRACFERLAVSLAQGYRFATPDLLRRNLDLAYAASAGVCGELKGYLTRADDLRAGQGVDMILKQHLEGAIYAEEDLVTLHEAASAFDVLRTPASASAIRRVLA